MALSCFCLAHVIPRKGDNPRFMSFHVLLLLHAAAVSLLCWGGVTSLLVLDGYHLAALRGTAT